MKKYAWIYVLLIAVMATSCKTQSTIHNPQSTIIHDSVSVTYKQGKVVSLAENAENAEQESAASQAQSSPKAQHDGLASQAQGCYSPQSPTKLAEYKGNSIYAEHKRNSICELGDEEPRAIKIRVDTVFIERWHTEQVTGNRRQVTGNRTKEKSYIKHQTFYKRCTAGFWVLLIGILIWIALRIWKAIYLKK